MFCVKCLTNNTKCVDDMLQVGYVAELYRCSDCGGTIEVIYKHDTIHKDMIDVYKYISPRN